jgi:hypothetical protein
MQVRNTTLAANLAGCKVTSFFLVQLEASRLLKPGNGIDLTVRVLKCMGNMCAALAPVLSQPIEQKGLERGLLYVHIYIYS